jgi:hypothetical protein
MVARIVDAECGFALCLKGFLLSVSNFLAMLFRCSFGLLARVCGIAVARFLQFLPL